MYFMYHVQVYDIQSFFAVSPELISNITYSKDINNRNLFRVTARGTQPLTFLWYLNNKVLEGSIERELSLSNNGFIVVENSEIELQELPRENSELTVVIRNRNSRQQVFSESLTSFILSFSIEEDDESDNLENNNNNDDNNNDDNDDNDDDYYDSGGIDNQDESNKGTFAKLYIASLLMNRACMLLCICNYCDYHIIYTCIYLLLIVVTNSQLDLSKLVALLLRTLLAIEQ